GYRLLIDTYSSTPPSAISAVETLSKLEIADGAQRIAVLSEIAFQGAKAAENHKKVGAAISEFDVDVVLCVGNHSREIVRVLKEQGKKAYFFTEHKSLNSHLVSIIQPNDLILFKGSSSQM